MAVFVFDFNSLRSSISGVQMIEYKYCNKEADFAPINMKISKSCTSTKDITTTKNNKEMSGLETCVWIPPLAKQNDQI